MRRRCWFTAVPIEKPTVNALAPSETRPRTAALRSAISAGSYTPVRTRVQWSPAVTERLTSL